MMDTSNPDYKTLIDQQTWSFIELTDSWYPPETVEYPIEKQRQIYTAMCREFNQGYPNGVTGSDATIASPNHNIPVRRYSCTDHASTSILYFHGGGFVVGDLESHDDICAELCAATGFDVTAVDYRLAPEHLHPASFEDSLNCVLFEGQRLGTPLLLCGDSAGANLAAAVSHAVRDNNSSVEIAGQVLIYPALGGDVNKGSYVEHRNAPMLTTRDVYFYTNIRSGDSQDLNDTTFAPLADTDFSNLPSTIVFSAECDPLADDGKHYCAAINSAGGNARCITETGLVHGYLRARHSVDRARDSFSTIVAALTSMSNQ